ncbi:hypothetical protein XBKB1_1560021 [Xenorhabdus bovienii str. kraussei Becker Underwood]|uniref:Uncharacterized protein n=1 Tax=Xenorhabdus bovienii str. kraussei Becker Underwood TaxID=1398204 RepID=A0A077PRP0_XENBV|nr:hypothetical protein XBKB1_1560021 [Xenorhabdus bovienii str. kraussei Becker Underwood]
MPEQEQVENTMHITRQPGIFSSSSPSVITNIIFHNSDKLTQLIDKIINSFFTR